MKEKKKIKREGGDEEEEEEDEKRQVGKRLESFDQLKRSIKYTAFRGLTSHRKFSGV